MQIKKQKYNYVHVVNNFHYGDVTDCLYFGGSDMESRNHEINHKINFMFQIGQCDKCVLHGTN